MKKVILFTSFMLVAAFTMPLAAYVSSTVNGNVIVTDTQTGLIWQKTYQSGKTWQQALDYCENLTYAGYSDWRLPDKNELAALVTYAIYDPASSFPNMPSQSFWSSSTLVSNTSNAWHVYFGNGGVGSGSKTNTMYVRCVRNAD